MADTNYLPRMHDNLVKQYVFIANVLSLADQCNQPGAYKAVTWRHALKRRRRRGRGILCKPFKKGAYGIDNSY